MARNFIIKTKYTADGSQVEKTQTRMSKGFSRFATQMADGNSMVSKSFTRMNQGINRIAQVGLIALAGAIGLATAEYIQFDNAITQTVAKFADVDIGTQNYIDTQKALAAETRRVAAISEFSATAVAGAADKYAMAGVSSEQTLKLLANTTDLATAAGVDLVTAVDIATDSLGAFGKMTTNTIQLEKNLTQISDQMAKTTTTSNTSLTELFEAVGNGAKTFVDAGQSMATFNAAAGILANSSIKGGEAGTALRNVMLRLAKPSAEAQAQLESLGVSIQDGQGNFKDITSIMADFEKGLEGMGTRQKSAALSTIFGVKTVNSFNILLAEGSEKLKAYSDQIENSSGASKEMANAMRQSLSTQIEILKSGLIELGFKFVEAFEKDGRGALQGLIDTVQKIDIQPLINFAKVAVTIFKFLASNWKILLSFAAGIKAVAIAMGVLNIITTVFGKTLEATPVGKIITLVFLLAAAITLLVLNWDKVVSVLKMAWTWIANVGQKFLLLLGPIGLITSAVIEVIKQFGKIKEAFQTEGLIAGFKAIGTAILDGFKIPLESAWNVLKTFGLFLLDVLTPVFETVVTWISEVGQKFTFILGPIGLLTSALIEVVSQWGNIQSAFKSNGILAGIKAIGFAILNGMLAPIQGFLEIVSKIPGVGNLAAAGATKIDQLRSGLESTPTAGSLTPTFNNAETPTPMSNFGVNSNGTIDINIRNSAGDNAEINQKGAMPTGTSVNFTPAVSM